MLDDTGVSPAGGNGGSGRRAACHQPISQSSKPPSGRSLLFAEREEIAILRAQGHGVGAMSSTESLSHARSIVKLERNAARRHGAPEYRATTARWHADPPSRWPKPAKLAVNLILRDYAQDRLAGMIARPDGVPLVGPKVVWKGRPACIDSTDAGRRHGALEQISRRLRLDFPEDETMCMSDEAIYQGLYAQGREALRRELSACLRTSVVADAAGAHVQARQDLRFSRDHDQPTSGRGSRSSRTGPLGR